MSTPRERYHRQLRAARDVALSLAEEHARALLEILEEWAREIETRFARSLARGTDAAALREIRALINEMTRETAAATGDAVRLTARRVAEVQALATAELLSGAGSTLAVGAAFAGTGTRAAQAVLARPELAEAFVTIRREGAATANRILERGRLRGAPATSIARELRQFVALPGSVIEGNASVLADRRRIGYQTVKALGYEPTAENLALVRQEASSIAWRAQRIARTETSVAYAEAAVQAAIDSPVVQWIRWRLSYRHKIPCACEPIAELDLYGHGPGLYDPRCVPVRPHPNCFCWLEQVLRPEDQWGQPRAPVPPLLVDVDALAETLPLSPSAQRGFADAVGVGAGRMELVAA